MDLSLTEAQEMIKNTARSFLEQECPKERVRELDETETGFEPELWQRMVEMGWVDMMIPEEYGGSGSSFTDLGVLYEEMGRALLPSPHHSTAVLGVLTILEAGSAEQKERLLPAIARGELVMALALTEPDYGWEPKLVQMRASRREGHFVLDGIKLFIPDAHIADKILCVARTSDGDDPAEGITLFLVDKGSPGLSCRTLSGWMGTKLNEVKFESVEVPAENVLGSVDKGWAALAPVLEKAAVVLCAYMVGGGQGALDHSLEYTRTRVQFGSPIGTLQRVQDHMIDCVNGVDAARWTTYEALWKIDAGKPVAVAASVAKTASSEGYHKACDSAHRAHGAIALVKEYGLYMYTKSARTMYYYLGDPTHHRRRLAHLLGM